MQARRVKRASAGLPQGPGPEATSVYLQLRKVQLNCQSIQVLAKGKKLWIALRVRKLKLLRSLILTWTGL